MSKIRNLGCCVCGGYAGKFEQWHNRDTGFGVCLSCINWLKSRGETDAEILDLYGVEGVNYAAPFDPVHAPGHTDLMTAPEDIDAWLERNPPV
jgi:hypothetical protein